MQTTNARPMTADEKRFLELEFRKVWHGSDKMVRHCVASTSCYFISDDGVIVTFDKPTIKTDFPFPEHGFDYDEATEAARAASTDEEFFIRENLEWVHDSYRAAWSGAHRLHPYIKRGAYVAQDHDCALGYIKMATGDGREPYGGPLIDPTFRKLTDGEVERLREVEERRDGLFVRRLKNYLKRYGMSKVHCWTYWADR